MRWPVAFWLFGFLAFWLSGFLTFWLFGFLFVLAFWPLAFWLFGFLAFWLLCFWGFCLVVCAGLWLFGFLAFWLFPVLGKADRWLVGVLLLFCILSFLGIVLARERWPLALVFWLSAFLAF